MTDPDRTVPDGAEQARTVTFTSDSLVAMITLTEIGGALRVDGWLSPAAITRVELRVTTGACPVADTDQDGRFIFTDVAPGPVRLLVHPPEEGPVVLRTAVVTPAVRL